MNYRTKLFYGCFLPALVSFLLLFSILGLASYHLGYFGNKAFQHEPGEWIIMVLTLLASVVVSSLVFIADALLMLRLQPISKRHAFFTGCLCVPIFWVLALVVKGMG